MLIGITCQNFISHIQKTKVLLESVGDVFEQHPITENMYVNSVVVRRSSSKPIPLYRHFECWSVLPPVRQVGLGRRTTDWRTDSVRPLLTSVWSSCRLSVGLMGGGHKGQCSKPKNRMIAKNGVKKSYDDINPTKIRAKNQASTRPGSFFLFCFLVHVVCRFTVLAFN